jgi:hypothetical protein
MLESISHRYAAINALGFVAVEAEPFRKRVSPTVTPYGPPVLAMGGVGSGRSGDAQALPSEMSSRTAKPTVTTVEDFMLASPILETIVYSI